MNRKEMKEFEEIYNYKLPKHSTVVVRCDGRNFKKVTERLNKPFDKFFSTIMENTMYDVASRIDGCDTAYCQSDEITFIIHNKGKETPFFGNRIQKIASIVASQVSTIFYTNFLALVMDYQEQASKLFEANPGEVDGDSIVKRIEDLSSVYLQLPVFDAKVFVIPEEDEEDIIEIRQNNCIANSINTMAHTYLESTVGKNQDQLLKELYESGHRWEDLPEEIKFGVSIAKITDPNNPEKKVWDRVRILGERATKLIEEEEARQARKENTEKEGE